MDDTEKTDIPYGGDVIAEHLIETYDIRPYILPSGVIGLHFMELSSSIETEGTILSHVREDIEGVKDRNGKIIACTESLARLNEMRCQLLAAAYALESALCEAGFPTAAPSPQNSTETPA